MTQYMCGDLNYENESFFNDLSTTCTCIGIVHRQRVQEEGHDGRDTGRSR